MFRAILLSTCFALLTGCIKDDFIDNSVNPEVRIIYIADTLAKDSSLQFKASYFDNVGKEENVTIDWKSANSSVLTITNDGIAKGISLGTSLVTAEHNNGSSLLMDNFLVTVDTATSIASLSKTGTIATTSTYALTGDFTLSRVGNSLKLDFASNYKASSTLPGLYIYLTNNNTTTVGAHEIGAVSVFSGAHSYTIPNVGLNDYSYVLYFCKPFNVKVGDGKIQ